MSNEANKALISRYLEEVWSHGRAEAIDELVDDAFTLRALQGSSGRPQVIARGITNLKQSVATYRYAFPDLQLGPEMMIAEGDQVLVQWSATATHLEAFRGILPTGKRVNYTGFNLYRVSAGKIVDELYLRERIGLLQQIGVAPEDQMPIWHVGRD